jgi:hypothetical protein
MDIAIPQKGATEAQRHGGTIKTPTSQRRKSQDAKERMALTRRHVTTGR